MKGLPMCITYYQMLFTLCSTNIIKNSFLLSYSRVTFSVPEVTKRIRLLAIHPSI